MAPAVALRRRVYSILRDHESVDILFAELADRFRDIGQPVLIPGDMGRYSFVLVGTPGAFSETFGSTCHGAGRRMSRHQAKKVARQRNVCRSLNTTQPKPTCETVGGHVMQRTTKGANLSVQD